jgi:hypothetical protein
MYSRQVRRKQVSPSTPPIGSAQQVEVNGNNPYEKKLRLFAEAIRSETSGDLLVPEHNEGAHALDCHREIGQRN